MRAWRVQSMFVILICILSCVSICILIGAYLVASIFYGQNQAKIDPYSTAAFDSETWKQFSFSNCEWVTDNPRGHMIVDLMRNHQMIGMSTREVLEMLGKADMEQDDVQSGEIYWSYFIGEYSSGPLIGGQDFLAITIKNGFVTGLRLVKCG
jgi:hypothetical protein